MQSNGTCLAGPPRKLDAGKNKYSYSMEQIQIATKFISQASINIIYIILFGVCAGIHSKCNNSIIKTIKKN